MTARVETPRENVTLNEEDQLLISVRSVLGCELQLRVAVAVAVASCELHCSCELQTDKIKIFLTLGKVR